MAKTNISFESPEEVTEALRAWALEFDYELVEKKDNHRLYKKKTMLSTWWFQLDKKGKKYKITAWIKDLTSEMAITGTTFSVISGIGGPMLMKKAFRGEVNKLFDLLEVPRIK